MGLKEHYERGKKRIGKMGKTMAPALKTLKKIGHGLKTTGHALAKAEKSSRPIVKRISKYSSNVGRRASEFAGGGWGDIAPRRTSHKRKDVGRKQTIVIRIEGSGGARVPSKKKHKRKRRSESSGGLTIW